MPTFQSWKKDGNVQVGERTLKQRDCRCLARDMKRERYTHREGPCSEEGWTQSSNSLSARMCGCGWVLCVSFMCVSQASPHTHWHRTACFCLVCFPLRYVWNVLAVVRVSLLVGVLSPQPVVRSGSRESCSSKSVGLVIKRSPLRIPAGAAGEFSSPQLASCFDLFNVPRVTSAAR